MIIGLAGLVGVVVAYLNRDELKGRPRGRELALYLAAVVVSIALGVAVILLTTANQQTCGPGRSGPAAGTSACA